MNTLRVNTYHQCNNTNRIQIRLGGSLFDFSIYQRIRFFMRNKSTFAIQEIDSITNGGTITVVSPGVLDLLFGEALEPGSYYAGLKVFTNANDPQGQMLFHDQQERLQFVVYDRRTTPAPTPSP